MTIKTVGIIGAGTMGNGIAHIFSKGGFNVVLCDVQQPLLDKAIATIGKNMDREVAKGKKTAEEKAARYASLGREETSAPAAEAAPGGDEAPEEEKGE